MPRQALAIRVMLLALAVGTRAFSADTRYHQYCKKATGSGGAVAALAATYFGGPSPEELVAVGIGADGGIIAVGNAWGPEFPAEPTPTVLGPDRYVPAEPYTDKEKKKLDPKNPNIAAFVVSYAPGLERVEKVVRLGWGMGTTTHCTIAPDGAVYLSGRCSAGFRHWLADSKTPGQVLAPPGGTGEGGDLYLAKLLPDKGQLAWVLVLEKAEDASADDESHMGRLPGVRSALRAEDELAFGAYDRLYAIKTDGAGLKELCPTGGGCLLYANPRDGSCYVGGDENTNTGREPWRRPFLRKFDKDGKQLWEVWRWDSKRVGEDKYRLVSDSGIRGVAPTPDGDLFVWGFSDGGNSVFSRQPNDLDQAVSYKSGFIDSLWGVGVGHFSWLMRIDDARQTFSLGSVWASFFTSRNKPNSASVDRALVLEDGRIAMVGGSSFALVETPDAWVKAFPEGSGGSYFAVWSADLKALLFSTLLPTVQGPLHAAARGTQVALVGKALAPKEGERQPILLRACRKDHAGEWDGYVLLAETKAHP